MQFPNIIFEVARNWSCTLSLWKQSLQSWEEANVDICHILLTHYLFILCYRKSVSLYKIYRFRTEVKKEKKTHWIPKENVMT